jgi:hypothetical protein
MFVYDLKNYSMERIQFSAVPNSLFLCFHCRCGPYHLQHTKSIINFKVIMSVMLERALFSFEARHSRCVFLNIKFKVDNSLNTNEVFISHWWKLAIGGN